MNEVDNDIEAGSPLDDGAAGNENEAPGLYVGVSGKQPNFLQKLYE